MSFQPILPPKAGYVECEAEDGSRYYAPTAELEAQLELEQENARTVSLFNARIMAQADRQDFLEDCIAEMAMMVYGE